MIETEEATRPETADAPQASTAMTLSPSRLPMSKAIAKEFDLGAAEWRVLVDQTFPSAKSTEAVLMALSYCRARKLDIFKKPVHIVPMWSSLLGRMVETVWPGIAEIRTTAARTGEYAGIDAVEFGPMLDQKFTGQSGGRNSETITKTVKFPEWASVVVYRIVRGQRSAFHTKVFWEETYATVGKSDVPNDMWAKRPRGQLDKCVEAAALRKAFPEEVGSMYAAEEMEGRVIDGTSTPVAPTPPAPPEPPAPPPPPPAGDNTPAEDLGNDDSGLVVDVGAKFLDEIATTLARAKTVDEVEQFFDELDVQSTFSSDEDGMTRAFAIKGEHLARVERAALTEAGQAEIPFPGDIPLKTRIASTP